MGAATVLLQIKKKRLREGRRAEVRFNLHETPLPQPREHPALL